jgi:hypothetical protein
MVGLAASYDVRYSLWPIDDTNFAAATAAAAPAPKAPGSAESLTLHSLTAGATYYLAIKVVDEWPLSSPISNVVTVEMPAADAEAPYPVTDMALLGAQSAAVHVTFTAPADRGTAGVQGYEVRYSTNPIDAGNWGSAALAVPPAAAAPGTAVNVAIRDIVGSTTYYVAMKSFDWAEPSNVSDLSNVVSGTTLPPITAIALQNPWIANDRVANTRTLQTLAATFGNAYTPDGVIPGATNQDKVINEYNNFKRREYHWADDPPLRYDVVRNINIYGHSLCGGQADQNVAILEAMGFDARCGSIPGHTIYDVYYDGQWHLFDTMMTMYVFDRSSPPKVASAAQIAADKTLMTAAVAEGRACPGFLLCPDDVTWFANGTGSWSPFSETGGATTYSMNTSLRFGEAFDRTWESWYNQHPAPRTSADSLAGADAPYHHCARNDWKDYVNFPYWEPYALTPAQHTALNIGYGFCYRRWSNGTYTLRPDFRSAGYQASVHGTPVSISTVGADRLMPQLHAAAANTLAEIIFKVATPFNITDANISGEFVRAAAGDVTKLYISTNGTSFTQIWDNTALGTTQLNNLNVRTTVHGRTEYYIKVQLKGVSGKTDAGVNNLVISSIFQHNKGSMAYLDKGVNNITVTFDNPAELAASGAAFKVVYRWKEYDGTDWTINKTREQYILTSPTTFSITTGGAKVPKTESIVMEVCEPPFDPYCPGRVGDLDTENPDSYSMGLVWTATGDDASAGQASAYDIRYSTSEIDDDNWAAATLVTDAPAPQMSGATERFTVSGLEPRTTYYFAMKVRDEASNWSTLSNIAIGQTLPPDEIPPAWVCNLVARRSKTGGAVDLAWTATGDDDNAGTARTYDLRYSTAPIDEANFAAAAPVAGVPAPKVAGSAETFTVTGLNPGTRFYFALKVADERPNWSEISNTGSAEPSQLGEKILQTGTSSYNGCRDNYTQSSGPTTNFGSYERMRVTGYADQGDIQRGYIKFDVSSIPAGTVIGRATLCLYSYDTTKMQGSTGFYGAHRITRNWNDLTMNWNVADAGISWTTPGGDFEPAADALSPKYAPKVPSWYQWDVTARVQEWINAPAGNYGWLIKAQNESSHLQDQFYQADTANSMYRPKLIISDYADPVPGDISGDGSVDVVDLLYFVDSFGSLCQVDRNFDPLCDFNSDGIVDVVDLLTFVQDYWPQE